MNEAHIFKIAGELKVQPRQVAATAKLFAEGATIPFIARYPKEATGSLDEVAVTSIRERLLSLAELDQRRDAILKSLADRNLLTDELKGAIAKSETLTALEDIYQPYRPKRRTAADHSARACLWGGWLPWRNSPERHPGFRGRVVVDLLTHRERV